MDWRADRNSLLYGIDDVPIRIPARRLREDRHSGGIIGVFAPNVMLGRVRAWMALIAFDFSQFATRATSTRLFVA